MLALWAAAAMLAAGATILMLRAAKANSAATAATGESGAESGAAPGHAPAWAAPALCIAPALVAAIVYVGVGSPRLGDQGYAKRLAEWRRAPETLGPSEAAAVLQTIVRERPADAQARTQLGRARLASGEAFAAARAFEAAAALRPREAERWTDLAEALLALDPPAVAEARRALERAQGLAPRSLETRYWDGRVAVEAGEVARGVAVWRALADDAGLDPARRVALESEIAQAEGGGSPQVDAAIAGMVDRLAARLRAQPDDPQGWTQLARAYAVLDRERDLAETLIEVRRRFAGRADVVAAVEAAAREGRASRTLRDRP